MDLPQAAALLLLSLFLRPPTAASFNITTILRKHHQFSAFNDQLTRTNLATAINKRQTITVCAVNNSDMQNLINKNLDAAAMKNLLSLHVLVDYFDAQKIHDISDGSAAVSTMFQATGDAGGSSGIVNITDLKGGRVNFTTQDADGRVTGFAYFVKEILADPYNISVIQISDFLNSPGAEAPSPPAPPQVNLTANMSAHGCKVFAEILANSTSAQRTFDDNSGSGLTVFCPGDDAMRIFLPKFRNLSAEGKVSLLEYHGMPIYQTMANLRSNNKLVRTLATDEGKANYEFRVQDNGTEVTIETKIVTANVVSTVFDSPQEVAIFQLDEVLMPGELFNSSLPPTTAPAPSPETAPTTAPSPETAPTTAPSPSPENAPATAPVPEAGSPTPSRPKSPPSPPAPPADTPADSPADAPAADQNGNGNGAARFNDMGVGAVILSLWFVVLQL